MRVSDHRSLPDLTLNLYLYPVAAWGLALAACYAGGRAPFAIFLCYPLVLWFVVLTTTWWIRCTRAMSRGDLTEPEVRAGAVSVVRILGGAAFCPAIVFMATDPFAPSAWSTTIGISVVFMFTWFGAGWIANSASNTAKTAALGLALLALPVAATGAVTVASMLGFYDVVVDSTPIPDVLQRTH